MLSSTAQANTKESDKVFELGPLEYAFPCPKSKILDFLCVFQDYGYSASEIARNSGVPLKTALDEIRMLVKDGIVAQRGSDKSHMYKLDLNSAQAEAINKLALEIAISKIKIQGDGSDEEA